MVNFLKLPVGLQLYSVIEDLASDFEGIMKRVSEIGQTNDLIIAVPVAFR